VTTGVTTGNYESTSDWLSTKDIIVATSEKVDSLVRNGADWLSDLTCVVSDEVHLIDDRNRGPTLEVTLAKLRKLNPACRSSRFRRRSVTPTKSPTGSTPRSWTPTGGRSTSRWASTTATR